MIKAKYTVASGEIAKVDGGYVLRFTAYPRSYERGADQGMRDFDSYRSRAHWECVCKTWEQACKRLKEFVDHEEQELHGDAE